jgi:ribosomal-protein-alanine N-acetyltransferase
LFLQWRGEPSSVRHNPLKALSTDEIERMLRSEGSDMSDLRSHESYRWFVQYDGGVVGNVSLKNISHMMSYGEIGYAIAEAYQGKGIATAALRMFIEKTYSESSLRKLLAYVHDKNLASCRVLEKLGFKQEGLLREHYIINGVAENELLFGLLKHEWKSGRSC